MRHGFEIAATNARAWRRRGLEPVCARCRMYGTSPPTVSDDDREWWLQRFTLAEIRMMAGAIWPELDAVGVDPNL